MSLQVMFFFYFAWVLDGRNRIYSKFSFVFDLLLFEMLFCFYYSRCYNLSDQSVCLFRFAPTHRDIMEAEPARNADYTNQEYADMLIVYGACNMVGRRAAEEYSLWFPNRRHPEQAGRVHVRNPDGGRRRGARAEHDEEILDCFAEDPTTSLRRTTQLIGTSYSTCQRVMKEDKQHPYKYRRIHEISKSRIFFYFLAKIALIYLRALDDIRDSLFIVFCI